MFYFSQFCAASGHAGTFGTVTRKMISAVPLHSLHVLFFYRSTDPTSFFNGKNPSKYAGTALTSVFIQIMASQPTIKLPKM